MNEVVMSVKRVSEVIADITVASQEQSQGIHKTNQAILLMDETTQQNVALVEEAAAGAQSLQDQANQLANIVASFKLERNDSSPSERRLVRG